MTNAAVVSFKNELMMIGSDIESRHADEFARDRRWDVTITPSKA
jgi:hypothetical protein